MKILDRLLLFGAFSGAFVCAFAQSSITKSALAYRPLDAKYSNALARMILVSANPNQLHIFDPESQVDQIVNLSKAPYTVVLSPNGLHAAVGHDSLITYINLSTAAVEKTFIISVTAQTLTLSATWIYVMPTYEGGSVSVNISTGAVTPNTGVFYGSGGWLDPAVNTIYGTQDGLSPNDLLKYDISTGPITSQSASPWYHGDYPVCGPLWPSADGSRIYTGCGTAFRASTDSTLDRLYVTTLAGATAVRTLTESTTLNRVALIQNTADYLQTNDGIVWLYDSSYLKPAGQFVLPSFAVGMNTFASHGHWIFFNSSSTALYVLMEADPSSGLLNDFALARISLSTPFPCGEFFSASTAGVMASGSLGSVNVTAAATCIYQAASDSSWLQIVSGGYGSGNGTLTYLARANPGSSPRTGVISMGGQTHTVTQDGAGASGSFTRLAYNVVDAKYDKALAKLIFVAANPDELHIYDPISHSDQLVPLTTPPFSVSLRPDGLFAAVGQDGWASYVNLQTGAVSSIFQVYTDVHHIALTSNDYAYLFPERDWSDLYSLRISTGTLTGTNAIYNGRVPALSIDGNTMYLGGNWFSEWDISQGIPAISSRYLSVSSCGNLWTMEDGNRLITACGTTFTTSPVPQYDLQQNGTLANASSGVTWADGSTIQQTIAVIPSVANSQSDTQLQAYGNAYLGFAGSLPLPTFQVGSSAIAGHGRWVFWDGSETRLYAVMQADAAGSLPSAFGVDVISPSTAGSGCTFSLSRTFANEPASGAEDFVSVTTGPNCVWTASSSAAWLTINVGSYAFGSTTLAFSSAPGASVNPRVATLTIAGQTFTVNQAGTAMATGTVTPASGSGSVQNFAATYSATTANGYHDLRWVEMLIAAATNGGGQSFCFVHYDVVGNAFWLYGDGGFFLGPVTPGAHSNLLQNSLCALDTSGSSVLGTGSVLTLNANLIFKAGGARNVYLRGMNLAGVDTGWIQQGTWTVSAAALGTMTVGPSSGSSSNGTQRTFTLTYPDPAGFAGAPFGWVQFLVAVASDGGGQPFCIVHYDRAGNGLWMYASDIGFFLGPVAPGASSNALNSAACSVNTAGATVQNIAGNLVVTVPVTPKAPMVRANKLFQRTLDVLNRDTGFQQTGTWTVN